VKRLLVGLWERESWSPPSREDVVLVLKITLAVIVSWTISRLVVSDDTLPYLASVASMFTVQATARASFVVAVQRSIGITVGVLVAAGIGSLVGLNAITVGLLIGASLSITNLVFRLPRATSLQLATSMLLVVAVGNQSGYAYRRVVESVIGAAVGVLVSTFVLPRSGLRDARDAFDRLGTRAASVLDLVGSGISGEWTAEQTATWRREARILRRRLVDEAEDLVGATAEEVNWHIVDRWRAERVVTVRAALPRLERVAIATSVITRGLDDFANLQVESGPRAMPTLGAFLCSAAQATRAFTDVALGRADEAAFDAAMEAANEQRERVRAAAQRRVTIDPVEMWTLYSAIVVETDRLLGDLTAPQPA
jgi:uncharacterized membrane protein YgaE (UPF0421/DUF939 family)